MRNKVLGCLGVGAVVVLIISLTMNLAFLLSSRLDTGVPGAQRPQRFQEVLVEEGKGRVSEKIVQIDLEGMISNLSGTGFGGFSAVEEVGRALRQAGEDDRVAAVVLRINSPGGEVTASDTLYQAVLQLDEKKPVIVYMDSIAASGGYYVACGAREIIAHPTTMTGSIGVIIAAPNYAELMEKVGVDMMVFKSGPYKDILRGSREMREEEKDILQDHVGEIYQRFVGIVAAARELDASALAGQGGLADGRVFSGAEAAASGLVDGTGYIEDAYEAARSAAGVPEAAVVRYQVVPSLAAFLGLLGKTGAEPTRIEVDVTSGLLPKLEPGRAYLLPAGLLGF